MLSNSIKVVITCIVGYYNFWSPTDCTHRSYLGYRDSYTVTPVLNGTWA